MQTSTIMFCQIIILQVLEKFLRKLALDELPQLFNILNGDMSFVGPRPVIADDKELIIERNKKGIYKIKPGLTGLAQINGGAALSTRQKIYYEEQYIKKMNLLFDLKIIFLTNNYLFNEYFNGSENHS